MSVAIKAEIPKANKRTSPIGLLKKLKILKSLLFITGLIVVVYAGFGVLYFQERGRCNDLESQIALQRGILQKPASAIGEVKQLQSQLTKTGAEISATQQLLHALSLPNPEEGVDVEIYDALVGLGAELDLNSMDGAVEITKIAASDLVENEDGSVTLPYTITMSGSRDALLDFISGITQNQEFLSSADLKGTTLTRETTCEDSPYSLELQLRVRTWPNLTSSDKEESPAPEGKE